MMFKNIIRKKNLIYVIAIFLGIAEKISQILLFAIPLKAVSIVSRGKVSALVRKLLSYVNIDIVTNENQFIFLLIVLILLVINVSLIKFLKNKVIKNIKIRKLKKMPLDKLNTNQKKFEKNFKKIEEFITIRTVLIYSFILLIFLFFYDFQITLIIISCCIINYIVTKKFKRIDKENKAKKELLVENNFRKTYINKIKNSYELVEYIRPIINTLIMVGIMTSIFLRESASISIILLFIIRNTLNQINVLIFKISGNNEFMKTIFTRKNLKKLL